MDAKLQIIDVPQGSDAWLKARIGIPTASMMKTVLSKKEDGETRTNYLYQLVAEVISGIPQPTWDGNADTLRGTKQEAEAKRQYDEHLQSFNPPLVGIDAGLGIRSNIGASPDMLINDVEGAPHGGAEMKSVRGHIQIKRLLNDVIPSEYLVQMHTNMFVWDRQWWDFISFSPNLPLFVKRLPRDNAMIARIVLGALEFNREKQQLIEKLQG